MIEKQYLDYEKAIILLANSMPSNESLIKPTLLHCIRVGTYLYQRGYSRNIVLGGYLHDVLEDTDVEPAHISQEFGDEILEIVKANSKNVTISDSNQKKVELTGRCIAAGEEAIIVKAADILDNYVYYEKNNRIPELQYCSKMATLLIKGLENSLTQKQLLINNQIIADLQNLLEKHPLKS